MFLLQLVKESSHYFRLYIQSIEHMFHTHIQYCVQYKNNRLFLDFNFKLSIDTETKHIQRLLKLEG